MCMDMQNKIRAMYSKYITLIVFYIYDLFCTLTTIQKGGGFSNGGGNYKMGSQEACSIC